MMRKGHEVRIRGVFGAVCTRLMYFIGLNVTPLSFMLRNNKGAGKYKKEVASAVI
jgi:hypothetical protein